MPDNLRSIRVPFNGFYYSILDSSIDDAIEYETHSLWEKYQTDDSYIISDAVHGATNFPELRKDLAERYFDEFTTELEHDIDLVMDWHFDELISPREYNFETDKIFAKVPLETVQKLFKLSELNNHKELTDQILERHSSRSGFISFYSNDVHTWLNKPVAEWDEIELETLLRAVMSIHVDLNEFTSRTELTVSDRVTEVHAEHVNWSQVENELAALNAA